MPRKSKSSSIEVVPLLLSLLVLIAGLIAGLYILSDDDEESNSSSSSSSSGMTGLQSFLSGEGFLPDTDGLFGTGFLSKWI